ncbi:EamA family transporter [Streptomyces sp. CA-249302]|uniref:EamA family transporter n=1 Tax=Streptomyces sp. CA-249302 TaxID=3240058 RepID=UPI003D8BA04C
MDTVFPVLALGAGSALVYAAAAVAQRVAAVRAAGAGGRSLGRSAAWWISVLLNALGALLHTAGLRYGSLVAVQMLGVLTLVAAPLLSALVLGRRMTSAQWSGTALTVAGVVGMLILVPAAGAGRPLDGPELAGVLSLTAVALGVPVALAAAARRAQAASPADVASLRRAAAVSLPGVASLRRAAAVSLPGVASLRRAAAVSLPGVASARRAAAASLPDAASVRWASTASLAYAAAAGVAFAAASALAQTAVLELTGQGLGRTGSAALVAAGTLLLAPAGLMLCQLAYRGGLEAPLATVTLVNPVFAAVIGIVVLDDRYPTGAPNALAGIAAACAAGRGVFLLARAEGGGAREKAQAGKGVDAAERRALLRGAAASPAVPRPLPLSHPLEVDLDGGGEPLHEFLEVE